jgi:hypothetical protein
MAIIGVAHELHHRAALGQDEGHCDPERGVEHRHDLGGRPPFGEGRVATQVGEQNRHLDLLAAQSRTAWILDQHTGQIRREVLVEQLVDALAQGAYEPALGKRGTLRSLELVRPNPRGHDRRGDDEHLQWQLGSQPQRPGERDEERAVGTPDPD